MAAAIFLPRFQEEKRIQGRFPAGEGHGVHARRTLRCLGTSAAQWHVKGAVNGWYCRYVEVLYANIQLYVYGILYHELSLCIIHIVHQKMTQ